MQTRVDPFVSYLKSPLWIPFFLRQDIPDFILPNRYRSLRFEHVYSLTSDSLESFFWYLLGKKWLKQDLSKTDVLLKSQILPLLCQTDEFIAFRTPKASILQRSMPSEGNTANLYQIPIVPAQESNLETTFYCCIILHLLKELPTVLSLFEGKVRKGLKNYVLYHLSNHKIVPDKDAGIQYWYLLSIALMLKIEPRTWIPKLRTTALYTNQKQMSQIFQLLTFRLLSDSSQIDESILLKFHEKKVDPFGYSLTSRHIMNEKETFWISYLFETYKWMLNYDSYRFYAFIKSQLDKIPRSAVLTSSEDISKTSRAIVLLGCIFETLMEDFESLIFTHLNLQREIDLHLIIEQSPLQATINEILNILNTRYLVSLEIIPNKIRFRRFLNQMDPVKKRFAIQVFDLISKNYKSDLSGFLKEENRRHRKRTNIDSKELIALIHKMKKNLFIQGSIYKKNKLFGKTRYYFKRDRIIDQILISDRQIDLEQLRTEKLRLKEVIIDIHSMTYEMEISSSNIMHEIESLIIAKINPEFIERRLKFTINKTLFDAAFFNKAIANFQAEFEYLNPKYHLKRYIDRWTTIFGRIQQTFSNIHRILAIKIEELREEQNQYELTVNLEQNVNTQIAELISKFDDFEFKIHSSLLQTYSRQYVYSLIEVLQQLDDQVTAKDYSIQNLSMKITSIVPKIRDLRKTVIDSWISQKNDFLQVISFYSNGMEIWKSLIKEIDEHQARIVHEVEQIDQQITQKLYSHQHEAALSLIKSALPEISQSIEKFLHEIKEKTESFLPKNRKLQYLLKTISSEATLQAVQLHKLLQYHRTEFRKDIQKNLEDQLFEHVTESIDEKINTLRESFLDLESLLSKGVKSNYKAMKVNYNEKLEGLKSVLHAHNSTIQNQLNEIDQQIKSDSNSKFIQLKSKWDLFHADFLQEVADLTQKLLDNKIISGCMQIAKDKNDFILPMKKIAQTLTMKSDFVKLRLTYLIQENKINASLLDKPARIELHNSDWRSWNRLQKYTSVHYREKSYQFSKIQTYYSQILKSNEFLTKKNQVKQLLFSLKGEITVHLSEFEQYIHDLNRQNVLISNEITAYLKNIEEIRENIQQILTTILDSQKLEDFIQGQTHQVEEYINSEIHRLSSLFERRKHTSLIKNLKWLKMQETGFKEQFQDIFHDITQRIHTNPDSSLKTISTEFTRCFSTQTQPYHEDFQSFLESLREKFLNWERERINMNISSFLQKAQEKLSLTAHKLDLSIISRIRRKDFLYAAKLLKNRTKLLKTTLKSWNKQFLSEIKRINRVSPNIKIKQIPHFKAQWNGIQQDFQEISIESQHIALITELVVQFTRFSIKSLNQKYIPLKSYCENLHFKHQVIEQTLKTLISEGQLSGQLDMVSDIYYEGTEIPTDSVITQLNIIKKTNVRTYLLIMRLKNVFSLIAPILGGLGSILTIIWYLTRLSNSIFLILGSVLIILVLIIFFWIRRGKVKLGK